MCRSPLECRRQLFNWYSGWLLSAPLPTRSFASTSRRRRSDKVFVPVGSNGVVSIDIFSPSKKHYQDGLLLYFPRGPIPITGILSEEPSSLQSLADAAGTPTIRINYRLSSNEPERYPLPVHDVGAVWTWVKSNIDEIRPYKFRGDSRRKIGVAGQFIGGSLAAMLALTSCHLPPEIAVTASYLGNPIVDWTMMTAIPTDTVQKDDLRPDKSKKERGKRHKPASSWLANAVNPFLPSARLLSLRHTLFAKQQYPFDPFASPLLFFRTPGSLEPTAVSEDDEIFATLQGTAIEEDYSSDTLIDSYVEGQLGVGEDLLMRDNADSVLSVVPLRDKGQDEDSTPDGSAMTGNIQSDGVLKRPPAYRRSHRRWPPLRSGLTLPRMHITVGSTSPLRDMIYELAAAMERSERLYGLYGTMKNGRVESKKASPDFLAGIDRGSTETLTTIEDRGGLGVWDEDELRRIGSWFKMQWRGPMV